MSLYITAKQSILDAANNQNATKLTATDVSFGQPTVAPDDVVTTSGKNTQIRLTGNGTTWTGTVVVNYTRLNLSDIVTLTSDTLRVAAVSSTKELINYLNYLYGMLLTEDDIVDEPITLDAQGSGTATINAAAGSLGWVGSVTLKLVKGDAIVDFTLTETSLDGLNYPSGQSTKGQAILVFYPFDFTSLKPTIDKLPEGTVFNNATGDMGDFLNGINTISGLTWVILNQPTTAQKIRNLMYGKVTYNGLNSPEFDTNQDYKYAMFIQLSDGSPNAIAGNYNSGYYGSLVLHYNDPA